MLLVMLSADLHEAAIERATETFGALSTPSRLRILLALADGEATVTDLVDATGFPQPLVSQHLKTLRGLRLARVRRSGRQAYYALDDDHILGIINDALDHAHEELSHPRRTTPTGDSSQGANAWEHSTLDAETYR